MRIQAFTMLPLAATAVLLASAPAAAVTTIQYEKSLTQTINFTQSFSTTQQHTGNQGVTLTTGTAPLISFQQFNPIGSQGQTLTLTSIDIIFTRTLTANITLNNGSGNARNGSIRFTLDSTLSSLPLFTNTSQVGSSVIPFTLAGNSQGQISTGTLGGTTTTSLSPSDLSPYIGSGTISVLHNLSNFISTATFTGGGQGNLRGTANGTIQGEFQIVYNFLDPLPEPASWAQMVIGFGLAGGLARRQRRRTA
jgi:hypothetical protein